MFKQLRDIPDGERLENPLLVLSLYKGRPRGSQNEHHLYIARFLMPSGRYKYIRPDEKDVDEKATAAAGYPVLKPGVKMVDVINEKAFGVCGVRERMDPVLKQRVSVPYTVEGLFYYYVPIYKRNQDKKPPFPGGQYVGIEHRGDYRFYKFLKVPGFVGDIDWSTGAQKLISDGKYKVPQKLMKLQINDPKDAMDAARLEGGDLPRGVPGHLDEMPSTHDVPVMGHESIHNKPVQTEATEAALDVRITKDMDPFEAVAATLPLRRERTGKLALPPAEELRVNPSAIVNAVRVSGLPSWAVNKFRDEADLLEQLRTKPVTTLLTLGKIKLSVTTKALNDQLAKEWMYFVTGTAREDFDAFKETKVFKEKEGLDEYHRTEFNWKRSRAHKMRKRLVADLQGHGWEKLYETAYSYQADEHPQHTFKKYAEAAVNNEIARVSKKMAESEDLGGIDYEIVNEEDVEEAARQQGPKRPLSPDEAAELKRLAVPARATLTNIASSLHPTLDKVLMASLWLDDNDELEEARRISGRKTARAGTLRETKSSVDPLAFQQDLKDIAAKQQIWEDPEVPGRMIDFSKLKEARQRYYVKKWLSDAILAVKQQLSIDVTRANPGEGAPEYVPDEEWRNRSNWIPVSPHIEHKTMSAEDKLIQIALGEPLSADHRVLTGEGRMLKRYMELMAKVARASQRAHTDPVDVSSMRVLHTFPPVAAPPKPKRYAVIPPQPLVHQDSKTGWAYQGARPHELHPAIEFFNDSKHHALARKLGISFGVSGPVKTHDSAGIFATPNVSVGSFVSRHLDEAESHFNKLAAYRQLTPTELKGKTAALRAQIAEMGKVGHHIKKLHEATADLQQERRSVEVEATRRALREKIARHAAHVAKYHPDMPHEYERLGLGRETISPEHLVDATLRHSRRLRQAKANLTLLEFEAERRAAVRSVKKGVESDWSFAKAFLDLRAALVEIS